VAVSVANISVVDARNVTVTRVELDMMGPAPSCSTNAGIGKS
jgi:hypothetical protein